MVSSLVCLKTSSRFDIAANGGTSEIIASFTTDQKVGIGTTAPNVKLDVVGDVRVRGTSKLYFGFYLNY